MDVTLAIQARYANFNANSCLMEFRAFDSCRHTATMNPVIYCTGLIGNGFQWRPETRESAAGSKSTRY